MLRLRLSPRPKPDAIIIDAYDSSGARIQITITNEDHTTRQSIGIAAPPQIPVYRLKHAPRQPGQTDAQILAELSPVQ